MFPQHTSPCAQSVLPAVKPVTLLPVHPIVSFCAAHSCFLPLWSNTSPISKLVFVAEEPQRDTVTADNAKSSARKFGTASPPSFRRSPATVPVIHVVHRVFNLSKTPRHT
ncbi:hypothetical protein CCR75_008587 [Bremia lactucae]|uniref:Uncharacterized protein n=1 Tax=Bremia lactucae TaxID=4779 RepID=A0A976FN30_BRELC|nr:hypothetical protein CCR75_008587 [Bremia lactucae]